MSFIDADDWIDELFLEKVYHLAEVSSADIIETTKSYNYYSADNIKLFNKRNAQGFIANGTFLGVMLYGINYLKRSLLKITI